MRLPICHIEFMQRYIDLSSLVEVSEPRFIDHMGYGGWFVGFNYRFAGDTEPKTYARGLREKHGEVADYEMWYDGNHHRFVADASGEPIAVNNLRRDMLELLEKWSTFKAAQPQIEALFAQAGK